ncbi:MAG: recombinase family protein [Pirellulales bacterium]|nr:recombinase family protein [Pirellulales bacterium]
MTKKLANRGLFYTRDSGGKHETTPGEYVAWAQRQAIELGVEFSGNPDRIEAMIREGRSADGDLFLDYGVAGNLLTRPGLDAFTAEAKRDPRITHLFVPRRDRLARPDDPLDGCQMENDLRKSGKTLVFMDRVVGPLPRGTKQNIADQIVTLIDYDHAESERRTLAQKIIYAQITLARKGFSTGGRPPYGFERWLVKDDGTLLRKLEDGERVRMAGHHIVWHPGSEEKLAVIRRILEMLPTMPATRVARILNNEGIPSPDAGRCRKDGGVRHAVSGLWHSTTIMNIARNPLLMAISTYGNRSLGDKLRFTPQGPRDLVNADYRPDDRPKVIRNPEQNIISAPVNFQPIVDPSIHQQLLATLDARSGIQRGRPRSRDWTANPLGCRIFDMNCSWPMYREPYNGSFRYKCGLYQQSHGSQCAHNHIDGLQASRFVLSCIRQKLCMPGTLMKMKKRLQELALRDQEEKPQDKELSRKKASLAEMHNDLAIVTRNMARARSDEQYSAMAAEFDQLQSRMNGLQGEIAAEEERPVVDSQAEIQAALNLLDQLTDLAVKGENLDTIRQLFEIVNARLFLRFRPIPMKKRQINQITGGVLTFGTTPPPIECYQGPTNRKRIKGPGTVVVPRLGVEKDNPLPKTCVGGKEDNSLGNANRGDWI